MGYSGLHQLINPATDGHPKQEKKQNETHRPCY